MADNARAAAVGGARWTPVRIRGVPVQVGPSILLLVALFTWYLGTAFAGRGLIDPAPVAWVAAAVTTVVFILSVVAHEAGHAVASIDRGVRVRRITLFLLGGVTESVGEPRSPRDEAVIVGIGPFVSLLLAAVFGLLVRVLPAGSPPEVMAGYLAWLNLAMAIFNLIPGYPLDGGRLLRSALWRLTDSRYRATRLAAGVGRGFAGMLLVGAVLSLTGVPTVGSRALQVTLLVISSMGVWGGLVGLFLLRASIQAGRDARVRERLGRSSVGDLMGSVPPTIPEGTTLDDLVVRLQQRPSILWPVGRPLIGGVRLVDLDRVPRDGWSRTTVEQIVSRNVFIDRATPVDEALDRLSVAAHGMLIVVHDGEPVGLLSPSLVADVAPR